MYILYIKFGSLDLLNSINVQWDTFAILQVTKFQGFNKNTFHLEKSAVCHMDIQNYNSNYMNRRSIITYITIIIIKIKNVSLRFKAAIGHLCSENELLIKKED